jgi:hypothetical protein
MSTDEILALTRPRYKAPEVTQAITSLPAPLRACRGVLVDSNVLLDVATDDPVSERLAGARTCRNCGYRHDDHQSHHLCRGIDRLYNHRGVGRSPTCCSLSSGAAGAAVRLHVENLLVNDDEAIVIDTVTISRRTALADSDKTPLNFRVISSSMKRAEAGSHTQYDLLTHLPANSVMTSKSSVRFEAGGKIKCLPCEDS